MSKRYRILHLFLLSLLVLSPQLALADFEKTPAGMKQIYYGPAMDGGSLTFWVFCTCIDPSEARYPVSFTARLYSGTGAEAGIVANIFTLPYTTLGGGVPFAHGAVRIFAPSASAAYVSCNAYAEDAAGIKYYRPLIRNGKPRLPP